MQQILVILILLLCALYVAHRLWKSLRHPSRNPHCAGCPLADTCPHPSPSCCGRTPKG